MKKKFSIHAANKKPERQVDSIKYEIKKYIARERRKDLPEGFDFWDFCCFIGLDESSAQQIHLNEINPSIDKIVAAGASEFYLRLEAQEKKRNRS